MRAAVVCKECSVELLGEVRKASRCLCAVPGGLQCPGGGDIRPLAIKLAPETLFWRTVTLELPGLVSVTVCVLLFPTLTFPKLRLVGWSAIVIAEWGHC